MKARPQRGTAKAGRHAFSARSSFLTIRVGRYDSKAADPMHSFRVTLTRSHKGVQIDGKLVKLPHGVSKKALKLATKAGKKAAA